jgi:chromosome partitioning protein
LIPSHKNLIGANLELVDGEGREFRMREALAPLRERFQFIVIDCPPALDLLTLNALVAADTVLIPMQGEYFALEGISELLDTIERIRAGLNPQLGIEGVVLTMFDDRTNLAQQVMNELEKYFGEKLCTTTIPRNIRLAEAPSHGMPALMYDPRSKGAESYIRLAKEIIERQPSAVGHQPSAEIFATEGTEEHRGDGEETPEMDKTA